MAAAARGPLIRRAGRVAARLAAWIALAIGLFMLAAWVGSSIPRNADWREPDDGGVTIMVETNGVHTALVLPLVTPTKDWRATFPVRDIVAAERPYTHVSISWGEREVFLDTPTWWDLSPATALRVIGVGGEGLLHVAHYVRPAASPDIRPLRLSKQDYAALVAAITGQLGRDGPGPRHSGYGRNDVFYETGGRYTVTRTCNQWTSDMLAMAGVRVGQWTPFAGGTMKWIPPLIEE
ncbi:DUF2459 domain-containing protein [Novosphingobium aquimarinum]|uniref:DUF2459 domain-containing protein n=1 Tax=Novosphingobium aquimarinum TaxID=2682494 RepID=UPI001E495330|nr:DUF2459 domain-containing protein [Novosphingobium aquimarinum]